VTLVGGCGGGGPPPAPVPPSAAPPAASSAPAAASAAPPATAAITARKRTRTGAPAPLAHDGTKPKSGRPLNPKDALGRTVFVRADDQCFVEVAPKEKPPPDAPITRATEIVDCPPPADDPAWDHCTAQIVVDEGGAKCFCVTGVGNPRPMPNPTLCPASARGK
jgi:hypothetical protein